MPRFAILFAKGLEEFCASYLQKNFSIANIETHEGMLFFDYNEDLKKLLEIRIAEDILLFVKKFAGINRYRVSLRNLRHQAAKANFKKALEECMKLRKIGKQPSFSIDVDYEGRRDYNAKEALESVKEGIELHYSWDYQEKDANIHIPVIITPLLSFCGVSLAPRPLRELNSIKTMPGSLKNSLAYSMLVLSELKENEILLDPMCGTGIIPLEAKLFLAKSIGGDIDKEKISIAIENCKQRKVDCGFKVWDAKNTLLPDNFADKVVSNLPFGKQIKVENTKTFFSGFIDEMIRVSKKNAKFVFLTCHAPPIKEIIGGKNLKLEKEIRLLIQVLNQHSFY
jgi:23S rRNA G2445 N2-methylase RlmL